MKCQSLFFWKKKKKRSKISICHLLNFPSYQQEMSISSAHYINPRRSQNVKDGHMAGQCENSIPPHTPFAEGTVSTYHILFVYSFI